MSEIVDIEEWRGARAAAPQRSARAPDVFFERRELNLILNLYSFMVARGEWRDYAIGHDQESCSFAVFRRAADQPLYRIVKAPKLAKKQGAYVIIGHGGRVLKRGMTLANCLRFFDRQRLAVV
jgi:hypothetical protein